MRLLYMTAAVIPASFPSHPFCSAFSLLVPPLVPPEPQPRPEGSSPDEETFLERYLLYFLMDDSYRKYLCDIKYNGDARRTRGGTSSRWECLKSGSQIMHDVRSTLVNLFSDIYNHFIHAFKYRE